MEDILVHVVVAFLAATYSAALTYYVLSRRLRQQTLVGVDRPLSEDAMTRLYSYDTIPEVLQTRLAKARAPGKAVDPVSVILLDVDGFKKINTVYGMEGGDRLLMDLASLLKANIRGADDALFRYRVGDEFLVLCYGATGSIAAERIAARLSELIKSHSFYLSPVKEAEHISVSMGVTECREGERFDQMTRRLDSALEKAKKSKDAIELL
jgi:diguanylate cyclase